MQPIATSSVLPVICNEAVDDSDNEAEKKSVCLCDCGCVVVRLCRCVDEAEKKSGCLCGFSKQGGRFNNIVDKL